MQKNFATGLNVEILDYIDKSIGRSKLSANNIHPTAIISENALIDPTVTIGPYSIIGDNVKLNANVKIHSHVIIEGITEIGENCEIHPFAVIGSKTPDRKYKGEESRLIIGKNTILREHVTIHPGTAAGKMLTKIGDNCLIMGCCHVAHDCIVGDNVVIVNNAGLAGHVEVGDNVIIGGLSGIHQFVKIGNNAIIGFMAAVDSDVIPYGAIKGERAYLAGINIIGMRRANITNARILKVNKLVNEIFGEEDISDKLDLLIEKYGNEKEVLDIINFVKNNEHKRNLCSTRRNKK